MEAARAYVAPWLPALLLPYLADRSAAGCIVPGGCLQVAQCLMVTTKRMVYCLQAHPAGRQGHGTNTPCVCVQEGCREVGRGIKQPVHAPPRPMSFALLVAHNRQHEQFHPCCSIDQGGQLLVSHTPHTSVTLIGGSLTQGPWLHAVNTPS